MRIDLSRHRLPAASFGLLAGPANRVATTAEAAPDLLAHRPVKFSVFPTPQRVHRHQRHDFDDPPTESVGGDSQGGIQRKPTVAFSAPGPQINPAEGHRAAKGFDRAFGEISFDLPVTEPGGNTEISR